MNATALPMIPIQKDSPCVGHSPRFMNVVNTVLGSPLGPSVSNGIMIPKNPTMWRIRSRPSNLGRSHPARTLIMTANVSVAHDSSVPCHASGTYVGCVRMRSPCTSVPVKYAPEATAACQPINVNHPVPMVRCMPKAGSQGHTGDVTQRLANVPGREHVNPVILPARGRSPTNVRFSIAILTK
jgi:hypothetical protein